MLQTSVYQSLYNEILTLVPSASTPAQQFLHHFSNRLQQYYVLIQETTLLTEAERNDLLDHIAHINQKLIESVELTYAGRPAKAYECISQIADRIQANTRKIQAGQSFYRMRKVEDSKEKRTIDHVGMFHIPFSLRSIVLTQRYSMPGYPCLYLGETSFACWEELGRPNLDSCMVSRVENTEPFVVWDLRVPDIREWEESKQQFINSLKRFPLVIACTFRTFNERAAFKPEYIVPQLLLELLQDNKEIHGIEYTSIHWEREPDEASSRPMLNLGIDKSYYSNIVIPVQNVTFGTEHCPELCRIFRITDPTCEEYERIQPTAQHSISPTTDTDRYHLSLFGRLEQKLKQTESKEIVEHAPMRVADLMIRAEEVYIKRFADSILPTIFYMREKDYTHTPIVEQAQVVGVFSENTVFKSLFNDENIHIDNTIRFEDIHEYIRIDRTSHNYMYVKPQDFISDVRQRFEREHQKNDRKDLILVTSDGKPEGEFCGILTSYDLIVR